MKIVFLCPYGYCELRNCTKSMKNLSYARKTRHFEPYLTAPKTNRFPNILDILERFKGQIVTATTLTDNKDIFERKSFATRGL